MGGAQWDDKGLKKETLILWILQIETRTLPLADVDHSHNIASIGCDDNQISFSLLLLRTSYQEERVGVEKG